VILISKSPNRSCRFGGPNQETVTAGFVAKPLETVAAGFEAKPPETVTIGFEAKLVETVRVILMSNHSQTIDLDFETQSRNPRSSSPHAWCRPDTVPPDLSIARPPSTRPVRPSAVLYTRSPNSVTILVAARHAAPATCKPWDKQMRFSKRYKIKIKTKMSQIRIQISPSQWLITIKPRNWPLGFSISPLMSPLTTKAQSLKFESKTPWSTARRLKKSRKAQEDHLEEEKPQKLTNGTKSGKVKQNVKKELGEAQKSKKSSKLK
jgi:hypothetical protein